MKIVIAAWHLRNLNVGLGRYTYNLIESLGRVDQNNHYEILIPGKSHSFSVRPNVRYRLFPIPVFKRRLWEQVCPLMVGKYDLLHFPYDSCIGIKRGKFVVTMHDAKPQIFPQSLKTVDWKRIVKNMVIPNPIRQIDHVITVSENSRKDIIERLGIPKEAITVIYQGVECEKFSFSFHNTGKLYRGKPYVLSVAGKDQSKNIENLITAFSMLPSEIRTRHHLVIVGDVCGQKDIQRLVKHRGIETHTMFTGVVSDECLVSLYQQASVFVFPSLYEGFGLPVLEAMACGCPVISSNTSSLPEVVGEAGMMVDPLNIPEIVEAMGQVLTDPNLAGTMRHLGLMHAQQFSWDNTARATVALYEKIVNG
ncbi:MAG: glycosyltransferase family 1 protein [Nitrospirae bacterium]|nr:glycosyltransferase family 1 protein [Nitrospirota bacterium]